MPIRLVLVRHGLSLGNVASKAAKEGDGALMALLDNVHTSQWRLAPEGREQAKKAGEWLRENFPEPFGRYYVSSYVRAWETAGLLGLPDANWMEHAYLGEREWGQMSSLSPDERQTTFRREIERAKRDGLWWAPPGGESVAQVTQRVNDVLSTLARECSDKSVIAVCHSEVMWAFRFLLERMTEEQYRLLDESQDPLDRIHNCQVIEYSRQDPDNPDKITPRYDWMRSVCPWDPRRSRNEWQRIVRPRFSNARLLERVARYPSHEV